MTKISGDTLLSGVALWLLIFGSTSGTHGADVRLSDGPSGKEGRLEVYYNGEWGTVCDDYFTDNSATVFCKIMGYYGGGSFLNNDYGSGYGTIWLDNVICSGSETDIDSCSHVGWGSHNCGHYEDVSIRCYGELSDSSALIVRNDDMWDDGRKKKGPPGVYYDGQYGSICKDSYFGDSEALAICKDLGYDDGEAGDYWLFTAVEGHMWINQLDCGSSAGGINECSYNLYNRTLSGFTDYDCPEKATVICSNTAWWVWLLIGIGALVGLIFVIAVIAGIVKVVNKNSKRTAGVVRPQTRTTVTRTPGQLTTQTTSTGYNHYMSSTNTTTTGTSGVQPTNANGGYSSGVHYSQPAPQTGYGYPQSAPQTGYSNPAPQPGFAPPQGPPSSHLPPINSPQSQGETSAVPPPPSYNALYPSQEGQKY